MKLISSCIFGSVCNAEAHNVIAGWQGTGKRDRAELAIRRAFICLKGHIILIVIGTAFNKIKLVVIVCCIVKAFASNETPFGKIKHILDVNNPESHVVGNAWTQQDLYLPCDTLGLPTTLSVPPLSGGRNVSISGGTVTQELCKCVCYEESPNPLFIYFAWVPLFRWRIRKHIWVNFYAIISLLVV